MRVVKSFMLALAISLLAQTMHAGGPATVGSVSISGDGFFECQTNFVDSGSVFFIEVNYDGASPLTINTRFTSDPIDTELGLYDATGAIVATNDDIVFPGNLLSEIRLDALPAGQYFLGVGLFNTVYNPDFDATSTATDTGDVVVKFATDLFPVLEGIVNVPLNYNFNGIVHADEPSDPIFNPDDPNGFRSISDRALDFRNSVPSNETVDRYVLVTEGGELDIVHLGNRNTVSGGVWAFDDKADLDGNGIQPDWLLDPDQSGRQTTTLAKPVTMNNQSQLQLLFNISNGGGNFDIVVGFTDGSEVVRGASGPDWFGPFNGQPNIGIFEGAFGTDFAFADPLGENTLLLTEAIIDLRDFSGMQVDSIAFENGSNPNGGVAIYAANLVGGEPDCLLGDLNGDGFVTLLDVQPFVDAISTGVFSCAGDVNQDGVVDLLDVQPFVNILTGG